MQMIIIKRRMIAYKFFFIDFARTDFKCPHCQKEYDDDGRYLDKCNKNKSWRTKINCDCNKPFYLTYNFKGDPITYEYNLRSPR